MMMTEECWTNCFTQGSRRKSGEERGSEQMSKVKVVEAKIRKDKKKKVQSTDKYVWRDL